MKTEEVTPSSESRQTERQKPGFTPGTWAIKESKVPGYERNIDVVAGDFLICEVTGGGVSNPQVLEQVRANARLIAAAPALYEAAEAALRYIKTDPVLDDGGIAVYSKLRDAVASTQSSLSAVDSQ